MSKLLIENGRRKSTAIAALPLTALAGPMGSGPIGGPNGPGPNPTTQQKEQIRQQINQDKQQFREQQKQARQQFWQNEKQKIQQMRSTQSPQ